MFSISNIEMSSVILEITRVEEQVPGEGTKVGTDPARQRERWCLLLLLLENKLPGRVREPTPASESAMELLLTLVAAAPVHSQLRPHHAFSLEKGGMAKREVDSEERFTVL
ncbi:hypothetical protein V6N11_051149 [Hibiscus sabdariffa]|uniref:Uncharacterized protein n=1 Tax=Hibiscus sabdariffa TaxID=183260 RepID=A0ABR2R2Z2_9ROSI